MYMQNHDNETRRRVLVKTYEGSAKEEVNAEYNLPDYLPDVNRLLKVSAAVTDHGSYLSGETAEYDGKLRFSVLYATGDGSLKEAEFETDYAGNMPVMGLVADCDFRMEAEAGGVSCRLQNPRKLIAKAKVMLAVSVMAPISTSPVISGRLTAEEESALQSRAQAVNSVAIFTAEELGTAISEDLELEPSMPSIAEIISVELDPMMTDMKTTEKSLSYKGDLLTRILYLAKQEETAEAPTAPIYMTYQAKIPISGEIAFDRAIERPIPTAEVKIEHLEYRTQENAFGECRTFELDFEYSVMATIYANEENDITTDMYSTDYESASEVETLSFDTVLLARGFNFSVRGSMPRDDKDFDHIIMTTATASIDAMEKQGGKLIFAGNAEVSAILTNGAGIYLSRSFTVPFRAETDAARVGEDFHAVSKAQVIASTGRMDENAVLCDLEILISYVLFEKHEEAYIRACNVYKDRPITRADENLLTLYYPTSADTLWDVAKKYSTTVAELLSANNMTEDATSPVLIIPKRRTGTAKKIL